MPITLARCFYCNYINKYLSTKYYKACKTCIIHSKYNNISQTEYINNSEVNLINGVNKYTEPYRKNIKVIVEKIKTSTVIEGFESRVDRPRTISHSSNNEQAFRIRISEAPERRRFLGSPQPEYAYNNAFDLRLTCRCEVRRSAEYRGGTINAGKGLCSVSYVLLGRLFRPVDDPRRRTPPS